MSKENKDNEIDFSKDEIKLIKLSIIPTAIVIDNKTKTVKGELNVVGKGNQPIIIMEHDFDDIVGKINEVMQDSISAYKEAQNKAKIDALQKNTFKTKVK